MKPLVSIIIPTFNYAGYIRETVESALAQTYEQIEVIVIDDGSTDNTREVISDLIESNRLKYFYQDNRGLSSARNTGIRISEGKYISFLDSDDLISPKKVEVQLASLEDDCNYGVAFSDFRYFAYSDKSSLIPHRIRFSGDPTLRMILCGELMPIHSALFRRDILEKTDWFDESLESCEDYDFWIRLKVRNINFIYIDEVMALYRLHGNQMSGHRIRHYQSFLKVLNRYEQYDPVGARLSFAKFGRLIGNQFIYQNQMKEGRRYLRKYMFYNKKKVWRALLMLVMSYMFSGKIIKAMTDRELI